MSLFESVFEENGEKVKGKCGNNKMEHGEYSHSHGRSKKPITFGVL